MTHTPDTASPNGVPPAASHFALHVYLAVIRVIEHAALHAGSIEEAMKRWPLLESYAAELADHGLECMALHEARASWLERIDRFERTEKGGLPLRRLAEAFGLERDDLELIAAALLPEEEAGFGAVFEALHGQTGETRPTAGFLSRWSGRGSSRLRVLAARGVLELLPAQAPFAARAVAVPEPLSSVIRGDDHAWSAEGMAHRPLASSAALGELVLAQDVRRVAAGIADMRERLNVLVVRGLESNGRRTLARSIARSMSLATIEIDLKTALDPRRSALVGALSAALGALPMVNARVGSGETFELPAPDVFGGTACVVLPLTGGMTLPRDARCVEIVLPLPESAEREALWRLAAPADAEIDAPALSHRYRMSAGAIHRCGSGAYLHAALDGRSRIGFDDVRAARRTLGREALDALATCLPAQAGWSELVAARETREELELLEMRCRHRERMRDCLGRSALPGAAGIRALFKGPSGTGKTLAARALAASLDMDIYRLDLAAVTSKYVGETQKNLDQVLSAAETLDVIVLLDEGDGLLGARTAAQSVQTANDRYANGETNFLLQRLESFAGIMVITTNAADAIDAAFHRRMDCAIDFRAPGNEERLAIWQIHLPQGHAVAADRLAEIAWRCTMSGGQIRNAALHAALLALESGLPVSADDVERAVAREYRKAGAVCPLRRIALAQVG